MKDLAGRTAVVTGAAGGIGLALTERFVAAGMSVVMADIEEETLAREATRLETDGASVLGVLTDVRDPTAVESLRRIGEIGEATRGRVLRRNAEPIWRWLSIAAAESDVDSLAEVGEYWWSALSAYVAVRGRRLGG